jgi:hypothetical protein
MFINLAKDFFNINFLIQIKVCILIYVKNLEIVS